MQGRTSHNNVTHTGNAGSLPSSKRSNARRKLRNACTVESLEGRTLLSGSGIATPTLVAAAMTAPATVHVSWQDNDATATGYLVFRSTDGVNYTQIADLRSSNVCSFTDSATVSGNSYHYEIEAYSDTANSTVSTAAAMTTPLNAVSGLAATATGQTTVGLSWTDNDASATGYFVLRATDGVHFTQLTQLNSATANTYTDSTALAGHTYQYEIEAFNTATTAQASNIASATTQAAPTTVSIATKFGSELIITATGTNDSILVSESGLTFTITADGNTFTDAATSAGLFIYTRGGTDTVNIASSVTSSTTIETIDGAATTITSAGTAVSSWIDSTDTYTGTGTVHRVATFAGGVSKATGASLANPTDAGQTTTVNASLFGSGPVIADVNQGESGDCFFMSSLAAIAAQNPNLIVQSAVDMGDGTFVVQFKTNGTPSFIRVSNAFSTGPINGFSYANPGPDGSIWAMVMEKAFTYFRTGANTYASIASGWMGEVYADFGITYSNILVTPYNQTTLYNMLSADLAAGDPVTLGTPSTPPDLVGDHAYTLISVYTDSNGVQHYVVRNPWGVSGDSLENGQGYATLTYAQMIANFNEGCV
ncbi:MAG TPA: C2 family cysteine protease [Tepidisphaeraceae bacterium]